MSESMTGNPSRAAGDIPVTPDPIEVREIVARALMCDLAALQGEEPDHSDWVNADRVLAALREHGRLAEEGDIFGPLPKKPTTADQYERIGVATRYSVDVVHGHKSCTVWLDGELNEQMVPVFVRRETE